MGSYGLLSGLGLRVTLGHCMLFGALISPTDPVAVLGVLKSAGASKSMTTIIVGESLFNDGVGVVTYLLVAALVDGAAGPTPAGVALLLAREVFGGLAVGLGLGYLGYAMLRGVNGYAIEILITLALATGGYALADRLHVSALLAVVVMGLITGNHSARHAMKQRTRERLDMFWQLADEMLNLVVFGLIGLQLLSLEAPPPRWPPAWVSAAALIPVVLIARFASVAASLVVLRRPQRAGPQALTLLAWGGLRGAISLALALASPPSPDHALFVNATYAVVLFSLLVQAPTMRPLVRRLRGSMT